VTRDFALPSTWFYLLAEDPESFVKENSLVEERIPFRVTYKLKAMCLFYVTENSFCWKRGF
jgi:hypothetical protein